MAGKDNLRPINSEIAREMQKKSAEARRRNREEKINMKLALEVLMEGDTKDKDGNTMTGNEAICLKLFQQALKGNVKAFETIRSTIGQDQSQKIEVTAVNREECRKELEELFDE